MTNQKLITEIDKDLLIELSGANKGLATRVLDHAVKFSQLKKGSQVSNADILATYNYAMTHYRLLRGQGKKQIQLMSDYLLKKGLIQVDYRFGHLPILKESPIKCKEDFSPFESARIIGNPDGDGRSVERYVYVAGIYVPDRPFLFWGSRVETGKDNMSKIKELAYTPIEDIKSYKTLATVKGRFDD